MELSLISIATNGYGKYWLKMIDGFIANMKTIEHLDVHILTDDVEFIKKSAPKHPNVNYIIHFIRSEPWPYPTLLRYQYIHAILPHVVTKKFMYLDADMKIYPRFDEEFGELFMSHQMIFVAHPGYWRDGTTEVCIGIRNHWKRILSDQIRKIRLGAIGDWETNSKSQAFVSRNMRERYICGGIWFGDVGILRVLSFELQENTRIDLDRGVIAKWHDESHLNSWFTRHGGFVVGPEYCFDPTYSNLVGLSPRIEAVDKGDIKRV